MKNRIYKIGFYVCLLVFVVTASLLIGRELAIRYRLYKMEKMLEQAQVTSTSSENADESDEIEDEPEDETDKEIAEQDEQDDNNLQVEEQNDNNLKVEEQNDNNLQVGNAQGNQQKPDIPIDFAALQDQNPDIYAWIRIPNTPVDYPILQSSVADQDYYLDHNIYYSEGYPGCIYTQSVYTKKDFTDQVTVIYGHSMKNETMFGCLKHYTDREYREGKETIYIYTPNQILTYRIIFTVSYDNRLIPYMYDCRSEVEYTQFMNSIQEGRSIGNWMEDPWPATTEDRMIILSTCYGGEDGRLLIGAILEEVQGEYQRE